MSMGSLSKRRVVRNFRGYWSNLKECPPKTRTTLCRGRRSRVAGPINPRKSLLSKQQQYLRRAALWGPSKAVFPVAFAAQFLLIKFPFMVRTAQFGTQRNKWRTLYGAQENSPTCYGLDVRFAPLGRRQTEKGKVSSWWSAAARVGGDRGWWTCRRGVFLQYQRFLLCMAMAIRRCHHDHIVPILLGWYLVFLPLQYWNSQTLQFRVWPDNFRYKRFF